MNRPSTEQIYALLGQVAAELDEAYLKHPRLNSTHEGYSVILEELDEFWFELRKRRELRSSDAMRRELVQVAAMAVRTILDAVPL